MQSSFFPGQSSSAYPEKVTEVYLQAIHIIDDRVTPFLGKATTRVLVQGAARRIAVSYPFLHFLEKMPYTDVNPSVVREQLGGVSHQLLAAGLDALLQECFAGLRELTGNLIVPPLHEEITRLLEQLP
jgi:hypothetical protein